MTENYRMQELIRRAAAGEAAAAGALYEANRGLILKIARGYAALCRADIAAGLDDLMQAGYFAVLKAAQSWREEAGGWPGWLALHLRSEFNRALGRRNSRFLRPEHGAASLDAPLSEEESDGGSLLDQTADETLPESAGALIGEEIVRGVRAAVGRLENARQRYVIAESELKGRPYGALAQELGLSVETLRGDRARAFRALRRDRGLIALRQAHCIGPMTGCRYQGARSFRTSVAEGAARRKDAHTV